jgi:hypothetical protein
VDILENLLNKEFYSYYSKNRFVLKEDCIYDLLVDLDLEDLVNTINLLSRFYHEHDIDVLWFKPLCKTTINDAISSYIENIDISDYCENYDINDLISQNVRTWCYGDDEGEEIDKHTVTQTIEKWVTEDIKNEIIRCIRLTAPPQNIALYKNICFMCLS